MNVVITNNSGGAQDGYNGSNNKFINMTFVNNSNSYFSAFDIAGDNDFIFHNIAAPYTGSFNIQNGNRTTFSQTVVNSVSIDSHNNAKFTGSFIMLGSTPSCTITGGTNPGLVTGTCSNQGTSDANFILKPSLTSSTFKGPLAVAVAINSSNISGGNAFSSIFDWNHFENMFRVWIPDFGFPSVSTKGICASGNCRILDLRLQSTDTLMRNTTGDGSTQNEAFVNGANCPALLHGNRVTVSASSTPITFLTNAYEVMGSGGNNNGLCESNESCIYTPNFGAYQGEGDFWSNSCVFQNGTISNVKMYAYPVN